MSWIVLFDVARQFLVLSLLSFGGANAIISEIHLRSVEIEHWLTDSEFTQMFALAQAAPGPNVLIVSLIGYKAAGIAGGIVAMVAMCAPSSIVAWYVVGAWERFRDTPWRAALQSAIAPVTVGLVVASGYVLTRTVDHDWPAYAVTLATLALAMTTRIHPLWYLAVAAVLGALQLV
jgi:chromate transporter